jgi:hypothetical protein
MPQVKILCDTVLKQQPIQSTRLADNQKQSVQAGTIYNITSYAPVSDHLKFAISDQSIQGKNTWHVYQKHAVVSDNNQVVFPASVKLSVPFFDQLDNSETPYGTCNVTSIAMCLAYFGAPRKHPERRFPDELFDYCEANNLDRHSPYDLAKIVEAYGCKDSFSKTASFQRLKEWLIQGNPAVLHGYFTPSGHIVTVIGYNAKGFIVNDPYGELMYNYTPENSYYDTYASGAGLTYSYNMIYSTCVTGNSTELWAHFISR